ncbi:hypothetical protein K6U06_14945 [Acidiferrimicrobium sp. IK]|uniref:hypothetical protein n=1 Tax=Acidiferrimicrobium sp. IK TaxID=2871700 RepID=UPI0021CB0D26|nr:hypothetical protein [Acidiferrimicrobium sp. IK]MCU4185663.1 hypothetical protein [Acidiferrimicrobium sp. IK]
MADLPPSAGAGRGADPLGTRALFSPPGGSAGEAPLDPPPTGRRALFSEPAIGPRSVVVECRRCGRRTPVGVVHLTRQLVPSLWRPASRYSRYMRCPSCGRFGWCRLEWRAFRPL